VVVLGKADRCDDPAAAVARVRAHLDAGRVRDASPRARAPAGDVDWRGDEPASHGGADVPVGDEPVDEPVAVLALDARSPAAAEALLPWLVRGRTLVMLGSSGAGKTTLANTLARALDGDPIDTPGRTGAVRARDERGRHTTTARSLRRTAAGACLIDTPGLRQLWLDADAGDLHAAFPEIGALAPHCRYRDCRHEREPGCAVREGVSAERLANFRKLLRETLRDERDYFERRRERLLWRQLARARRQPPPCERA